MRSNAASIAPCRRLTSVCALARISTTVPSRGRARFTSIVSASLTSNCDRIGGQQAAYPVSDVRARERRATDVLDVVADADGIAVMTADELRTPVLVAYLSTVRLTILENLYAADLVIVAQGHRIVDEVVLADDGVGEEVAIADSPRARRAGKHLHARFLLDGPNLRCAQHQRVGSKRFACEHQLLRLLDAQVNDRVGRLHEGGGRQRNHQNARGRAHGSPLERQPQPQVESLEIAVDIEDLV